MAGSISEVVLKNRKVQMQGPLGERKMFIKAARVVEGMNKITETTIDWLSPDQKVELGKVVGQTIKIKVQKGDDEGGGHRLFVGTCIEAEYIGLHEGFGFYSLEVRPWLWFLTRTTNCAIFQNLTAEEIIKQVFNDRGHSDFTFSVSRKLEKRIYTVQYNETDYDFICRLMEEEGIYFYSTVKNGVDHLMLVDNIGPHVPVDGYATIEFAQREASYRRATDHVFEWRGSENVTSGRVTLRDYNFEKPKADMTTRNNIPKGNHPFKSYELYGYPGHYRETAVGTEHARIRMEAEAVRFSVRSAIGNVRTLANGATFKLQKHGRDEENQDYLIVNAIHMIQIEVQQKDESQEVKELPGTIEFDEKNKDTYRCTFQVIPKKVPYRAPFKTQWPKIPGILLAKVTGPSGEEIYTDKHGRIKVQFPWDRDGKNDENTSCWVRVVTPWSGKTWGMVAVPRMGQEVVIQFEDGDPDRPICTGMLYNADLMPPYALGANKTQSGIKTRSSKGGGDENYNELVFEDKKDDEFIRMHAEKDYFLTVENDATVSIGNDKKSPGSITTKIYQDRTENIEKGDLTLTVETGNEKRDIKTDRSEKIGANASQEVGGNKKMDVKGNFEGTTGGNSTAEVKGNSSETVTGTFKSSVTGSITIESKASIELKVGPSSIKIDMSGITIKGPVITTEAQGMATHKANGILTINGSMTMIN
ncbi:MAG: type VI secretion system Vgr family protein [Gemmobacter sp.]